MARGSIEKIARSKAESQVEIGLNAAIVSLRDYHPQILVVRGSRQVEQNWDALPFGPFTPTEHRTLEIGLRRWVSAQTGLGLGYVEQLYTFGDRGRHAVPGDAELHVVSIGYLALTPAGAEPQSTGAGWNPWYQHLPWEDWRDGEPAIIAKVIAPRLREWSRQEPESGAPERPLTRMERICVCFGLDGAGWDEEKVLERFELLYECGLVSEAKRDGRRAADQWTSLPELGRPLQFDHRRVLATAMGRLRGKLKYRPVVFELMQPEFTLFELQQTVEAISGTLLHKQNFRRLVENAGLVEATGDVRSATGGRPAKLFRFRRDVLMERPAPGVRVKAGRL